MKHVKGKSQWRLVRERFFKGRLNRIGIAFVFVMFAVALFAPFLAGNKPYAYHDGKNWTFPLFAETWPLSKMLSYPELRDVNFRKLAQEGKGGILPPIAYSPTEYDLDATLVGPQILPLSRTNHWLGTDDLGRDIAARMVHGARVSLSVGFVAVALYVIIGIFFGAVAGYFGGKTDMAVSRFIEVVMCFPAFFLILAVLAYIGKGLFNIMIVIGITSWTGIARLVRGEFLRLKNMDFVTSSRALGASTASIIFKHILPNAVSPLAVSVTFGVASSILIESSLSFLGFGIQPPEPSWGDILSRSREFMDVAWWLMVFPGFAIFLTVTAFNLVGEGLRDAMDPRE